MYCVLSSYRKGTCGKCSFQNVVNVETKVTASHLYSRRCTEINDSNMAGSTKNVVNVEAKVTASHVYGRSCTETNNSNMVHDTEDAVNVEAEVTASHLYGRMIQTWMVVLELLQQPRQSNHCN